MIFEGFDVGFVLFVHRAEGGVRRNMLSHFECQRQLCDLARQQHRGIVISHHCWGRAIKEPCERWARRRHAAYDEFLAAAAPEKSEDATLRILCS